MARAAGRRRLLGRGPRGAADNVCDGAFRYSDYAEGLVGSPLWSFRWH
ncbi:hypothetical protein ACWDO7_00675 [Streptomyces sp. NPDC003656]